MKRFRQIQKEAIENTNSSNQMTNLNGNENGSIKSEKQQVTEESAAAKLFPLNLLSKRFKNPQPEALKGN